MYIDMGIVPLERHCYRVAKCTGCLKLQVSFRKRATKYRAERYLFKAKCTGCLKLVSFRKRASKYNVYVSI